MNPDTSTATSLQGAVRLTHWGLISAHGADAQSFLHSQLTQAVQGLQADRARLAGYCSPKGRLLASFVMWSASAESVALACSADLLPATQKRLSMFVLRAKCKLTDASAEQRLWGLAGESAGRWLGPEAASAGAWKRGELAHSPGSSWIRLPDAEGVSRWLLVVPAEGAAPELPLMEVSLWDWLEVRSGVPRVVAATSDHFVPQMVNFELVGGVDFQKGCYPGQEIVARSQYRGTVKRRMVLTDADGPLSAGNEIHHGSDPDQPAGEVVLAAPGPTGRWAALVEVKLAMLNQAAGLTAAGVSLSPLTLPYPLPAEAA